VRQLLIPVFHKDAAIHGCVSPSGASKRDANLVVDCRCESIQGEMKALALSRRDAKEDSTPKLRQPRHDHYASPSNELVQVSTLEDLIADIRTITPDQQVRLSSDNRVWCVGDVNLLNRKCVAIVGTRQVSREGALRARRLGRELAAVGVVVVSGLAKGIDTEALNAAIEAGGKVIAVIGTPIDKAYPAENKHLQERIYRDHLLISQFPSGVRVFPSNFPERNKLMAALSDATAIIEAGDTSGTLHQAAECLRLARWLFIAKSVVDDPSLQWPKRFLGQPRVESFSSTGDILKAIGANIEEWH
jgi:DNA processing protein